MGSGNFDHILKSNVCELIAQQCESTPDKTAVISNGESHSYAAVDRRISEICNAISARGAAPGDLIGICVGRSFDMVAAVIAIIRCGCAFVPLDPEFPVARLRHMLEDSDLDLVLADERGAAILGSEKPALLELGAISGDEQYSAAPAVAQNDLAYIIYTSGSTGKPKGVCVEHSNLTNFLFGMAVQNLVRPGETLLAVTTLSFDIAGLELFLPLVMGGAIVIASDEETYDGERLKEFIEQYSVDVMQATPSTWRLLIEAGWRGRNGFRALCGGEKMPEDVAETLAKGCDEVWNLYGPTETTIWSMCYRVMPGDASIPIGEPIANTDIYILDKAGRETPVGIPGEIYIGGAGVARGYLNNIELTSERFILDPVKGGEARIYRTGDMGRQLPNGNFEYRGRIDDQVKIRGYRVELGDIESAISRHRAVKQSVCKIEEISASDQRIVAFCRVVDGENLNTEDLRDFLTSVLPGYMIPQHFVPVDAFPLTPNGKIDRRALPDFELENIGGGKFVPPDTPEERAVLDAAKSIFDLDEISASANFFEMGGHSLLAMRLLSLLRASICENLTIRAIFEASDFRDLAAQTVAINNAHSQDREELVI
ncbi:MAG: amino acid adenylation domain-containing protein [Marinicaulis sp.]|nr:amino acid adenylation domain-containing protein [Marinicaulis sp.]